MALRLPLIPLHLAERGAASRAIVSAAGTLASVNHPGANVMYTAPLDYDGLMQANLARVFGERDASRRLKAIAQLYAPDATLYELDAEAKGHAAINQAVEALLSHLPPNFAFSANGPAVGHHGIGRLRWQSGPPNGPVAVSGTDVAHFESGRIHSLYVFLDPSGT